MFSRITHIILLTVCAYLPALDSSGCQSTRTGDDLKEIISRISTDISYRNALKIHEAILLEEFYENNEYSLQWFATAASISKRSSLVRLISEPRKYMLEERSYPVAALSAGKIPTTKKDTLLAEIMFSDAALSFLKDIAYPTSSMVKYNGWKYQPDCTAIPSLLQQALIRDNLEFYIREAEPENIQYKKIKAAYDKLYELSVENDFHEITVESKTVSLSNKKLVNKLKQLGYMDMKDSTEKQLIKALNELQASHSLLVQKKINTYCLQVLNEPIKEKLEELRWNVRWYRWLNCMQNKSYILVNIAANRLSLIECNTEVLVSKIVVGKISTPSPTLTSAVKDLVYYPYWNVPFSIATKEMLPKLKRNPHYLDALKIDVLLGNHVYNSSADINWYNYSSRNFPFNFRQQPGCNNSLGLLKFDFENPFHVYLHDTNNKIAFMSGKRFFSHGCIRIEKPYELALALGVPSEKINMDSCFTDMKPQVIPLNRAIPIFVIYATVDIIDGELKWFEDAYHKREN